MAAKTPVLLLAWLPDGVREQLAGEFTDHEFVAAQDPADFARHWPQAQITYGVPPLDRLDEAPELRWIQLTSAGVPHELCAPASRRRLTVTNLAGLYGPTIAEHTLALMLLLSRNLHTALRNQQERRWDQDVRRGMADLSGRTLAILGLGNIGQHIARLARAFGMRVVGCRRTDRPVPGIDRLYLLAELREMLAEADFLAVAAPLTPQTRGMLGPAEFAALKRGAVFINVSRGAVADEDALLAALRSGQVAAGLDAYATEPLPAEHPFWTLPQVIVSPHYSGDTVNQSALPAERFARNLRCWSAGATLEGVVNLECGY